MCKDSCIYKYYTKYNITSNYIFINCQPNQIDINSEFIINNRIYKYSSCIIKRKDHYIYQRYINENEKIVIDDLYPIAINDNINQDKEAGVLFLYVFAGFNNLKKCKKIQTNFYKKYISYKNKYIKLKNNLLMI